MKALNSDMDSINSVEEFQQQIFCPATDSISELESDAAASISDVDCVAQLPISIPDLQNMAEWNHATKTVTCESIDTWRVHKGEPLHVLDVLEVAGSGETSSGVNAKNFPHHVLEKILIRRLNLQQQRKTSISPKFWMFKYKRKRRLLARFGVSTASKPGQRVLTINQTAPMLVYVPTYKELLSQVTSLGLEKLDSISSQEFQPEIPIVETVGEEVRVVLQSDLGYEVFESEALLQLWTIDDSISELSLMVPGLEEPNLIKKVSLEDEMIQQLELSDCAENFSSSFYANNIDSTTGVDSSRENSNRD